jgi:excisionase family DNA binding protein
MNVHDQAIRSLVSIDELADDLSVSVRHVRRLVSERRIPFYKWDRLLRLHRPEVNSGLESTRSPKSTTPDPLDRTDHLGAPTQRLEGGERADGA